MRKSDFFYDLPKELIAQDPLLKRTDSRLLVVDKNSGNVTHKHFTDIIDYIEKGDTLVLNESKVIPARLFSPRFRLRCSPASGTFKRMRPRSPRLQVKDVPLGYCLPRSGSLCRGGGFID